MQKGIYLNVLARVEASQKTPIDSQLALREVGQAVRDAAHRGVTVHKLSVDVKRVRIEPGSDASGLHVGLLIYLEGEQDAPSSFTKLATGDLETFLRTVFRRPTPSGLTVTMLKIEEHTNAVDDLADEAAGDP